METTETSKDTERDSNSTKTTNVDRNPNEKINKNNPPTPIPPCQNTNPNPQKESKSWYACSYCTRVLDTEQNLVNHIKDWHKISSSSFLKQIIHKKNIKNGPKQIIEIDLASDDDDDDGKEKKKNENVNVNGDGNKVKVNVNVKDKVNVKVNRNKTKSSAAPASRKSKTLPPATIQEVNSSPAVTITSPAPTPPPKTTPNSTPVKNNKKGRPRKSGSSNDKNKSSTNTSTNKNQGQNQGQGQGRDSRNIPSSKTAENIEFIDLDDSLTFNKEPLNLDEEEEVFVPLLSNPSEIIIQSEDNVQILKEADENDKETFEIADPDLLEVEILDSGQEEDEGQEEELEEEILKIDDNYNYDQTFVFQEIQEIPQNYQNYQNTENSSSSSFPTLTTENICDIQIQVNPQYDPPPPPPPEDEAPHHPPHLPQSKKGKKPRKLKILFKKDEEEPPPPVLSPQMPLLFQEEPQEPSFPISFSSCDQSYDQSTDPRLHKSTPVVIINKLSSSDLRKYKPSRSMVPVNVTWPEFSKFSKLSQNLEKENSENSEDGQNQNKNQNSTGGPNVTTPNSKKLFQKSRGRPRIHENYPCKKCDFIGEKYIDFSNHKKTHVKKRVKVGPPYNCDRCSYTGNSYMSLYMHKKRPHDQDGLCPASPVKGKGRPLKTGSPRDFKCEHCPYAALNKPGLYQHMRKFHIEFHLSKPRGQSTGRPRSIGQSTGSPLKPGKPGKPRNFKCELCPYAGLNKAGLNYHRNKYHSEEYCMYICTHPSCKHRSRSQLGFEIHSTIHSGGIGGPGEDPGELFYKCIEEDCSYVNKGVAGVYLHLKLKHRKKYKIIMLEEKNRKNKLKQNQGQGQGQLQGQGQGHLQQDESQGQGPGEIYNNYEEPGTLLPINMSNEKIVIKEEMLSDTEMEMEEWRNDPGSSQGQGHLGYGQGQGQSNNYFKRRGRRKSNFKCAKCPKKFTSESSLNFHSVFCGQTLPGSNLKVYECLVCTKKFIQRTELENHQKTHRGETKFSEKSGVNHNKVNLNINIKAQGKSQGQIRLGAGSYIAKKTTGQRQNLPQHQPQQNYGQNSGQGLNPQVQNPGQKNKRGRPKKTESQGGDQGQGQVGKVAKRRTGGGKLTKSSKSSTVAKKSGGSGNNGKKGKKKIIIEESEVESNAGSSSTNYDSDEGKTTYRCELCPFVCVEERKLEMHRKIHRVGMTYTCPNCPSINPSDNTQFENFGLLQRHMSQEHGITLF